MKFCFRWNWKFVHAVSTGNHAEVAHCISRGANPALKYGAGNFSALHHAAGLGHVRIAKLLLDHGWDVEDVAESSWRPLHYAACNGHVQMIQLLVRRGAMVDCQDIYKDTPLHLAADEGHAASVSLLLRLGADRTIKNAAGNAAEDLAEDENTRKAFKDQDTQQAASADIATGAKKKISNSPKTDVGLDCRQENFNETPLQDTGAMEVGYQRDEEDTAVPMSYDEKRQVSVVISVTSVT